MWVHFLLKGAPGGLPGGGGNGTSTTVLNSTLGDTDPHQRPQRRRHREPAHDPFSFPLVTAKIDNVAGIDYSLLAPPIATTETLDGQLKVRLIPTIIYPHSWGSPSSPKSYKDSTLSSLSQPPASESSPCSGTRASCHSWNTLGLLYPWPWPWPLLLPRDPLALPSFLQVSTQISSLPGDTSSDQCH